MRDQPHEIQSARFIPMVQLIPCRFHRERMGQRCNFKTQIAGHYRAVVPTSRFELLNKNTDTPVTKLGVSAVVFTQSRG